MDSEPLPCRLDSLKPPPRGVIFDYGNTLIPFGRREMDLIGAAVAGFLGHEVPDADPADVAEAVRGAWVALHRQRLETDRESDPRDVIRLAMRSLGSVADEDGHVERGIRAMLDAFVSAVTIGDGVRDVLGELKRRGLKLGFLSNYSLAEAIHLSARKVGIRDYFDAFVVSAELGLVKPHPELFLVTARRLGLEPGEILFVGDNPRADIAGAAAVGMRTAHITEHLDGRYHFEHPDEEFVEIRPDLTLGKLTDLIRGD